MGTKHFISWELIQWTFLSLHWNQPSLAVLSFSGINHISCVWDFPGDQTGEDRGAKLSSFRQLISKLDQPCRRTPCARNADTCLAQARGRCHGISRGTSQAKHTVILEGLKHEKYIKIANEPTGFPLIKGRADFWIIKSRRIIEESELDSGDVCISSEWWGRHGQVTFCFCVFCLR